MFWSWVFPVVRNPDNSGSQFPSDVDVSNVRIPQRTSNLFCDLFFHGFEECIILRQTQGTCISCCLLFQLEPAGLSHDALAREWWGGRWHQDAFGEEVAGGLVALLGWKGVDQDGPTNFPWRSLQSQHKKKHRESWNPNPLQTHLDIFLNLEMCLYSKYHDLYTNGLLSIKKLWRLKAQERRPCICCRILFHVHCTRGSQKKQKWTTIYNNNSPLLSKETSLTKSQSPPFVFFLAGAEKGLRVRSQMRQYYKPFANWFMTKAYHVPEDPKACPHPLGQGDKGQSKQR